MAGRHHHNGRSRPRVRSTSEAAAATVKPGTAGATRSGGLAEEAAAVAHDAAAVAQEAAAVAQSLAQTAESGADPSAEDSAIVQQAAAVLEEAAAVVEEAAHVLQESTDAATWPHKERRRRPRKSHHHARVHWKHLAIYAPILIVAVLVGAVAIWSFLEKQSLAVTPAPLPAVTIVTTNPQSPLAAAWVRLLTEAEISVTVVPANHFEPITKGILAICDASDLPPAVADAIGTHQAAGGAVLLAGAPPATPIAGIPGQSDAGISDHAIRLADNGSPVLARTNPGSHIPMRPGPVAFLMESPRMSVDARWSGNARAALAHLDDGRSRILWAGFHPDALVGDRRQLHLVIRTALRWLDGQPVSEGAVGDAAVANPFTPAARRAARAEGFAFSVDVLRAKRTFSVTMTNRGRKALKNPTVKVWLPPGVPGLELAGDLIMRRKAVVTNLPEERAALIALPSLAAQQQRVLKVRVGEPPDESGAQ